MKAGLKQMNGVLKDGLLTLTLGVLALLALFGTGWITNMSFDGQGSVAVAYEDDPIKDRTLIDFSVNDAGDSSVVTYRYYGDKLPEKLHPDEEVSLRNDASYTVLIGIEGQGTSQEKKIYNTISYAQGSFLQEGNTWYYIEKAKTSRQNLERKLQQVIRLPRIISTAHAADYIVGAGDSYAINSLGATSTSASVWYTAQTSLEGTGTSTIDQVLTFQSGITSIKTTFGFVYRSFLPFDTSGIPANATISSASLNVYGTTTTCSMLGATDNDGNDFVTVVQTSQAQSTGLLLTDYDQAGAVKNPTEGIDAGSRKDISSGGFATSSGGLSALNTFTLNSTGRGWIKKSGEVSNCGVTSGVTCLGLREGHDVLSNLPADPSTTGGCLVASEYTGTSIDPYLSVTYTVPSGAFWQFQDY